ncbi:MAG: hypothetical protein Q8O67_28760 [Deltaproteobacteria bacterium]|nr:hypothetical protein [Deltaproteobacteria bacterium]
MNRAALVAAVVVMSVAGSARAGGFLPTALRLDAVTVLDAVAVVAAFSPTLPLDLLASRAPPVQLPPDYAWVERDTRAFWYSAGASAVTSLGTHVLVGIPVLVIASAGIAGIAATAPITALALAVGVVGLYAFSESLLSSLAGFLVFNGMSETYEGNYLTCLLAHFGGNLASTAVTTLTFGGGALLFHGMGLLSEFTGGAGLQTVQIFSFLGAMPAIVIAGIAIVAVPALASAWALAVSATPRAGYEIDDQWLSPAEAALEPRIRREPVVVTSFTLPLPIP